MRSRSGLAALLGSLLLGIALVASACSSTAATAGPPESAEPVAVTEAAESVDVTEATEPVAVTEATEPVGVTEDSVADSSTTAVEQSAAVSLVGEPLPDHPDDVAITVDAENDQAIGLVAPSFTATAFDGSSVEIGPGSQPTILLFVAHWCPHCQVEVPMVQSLLSEGRLPDDVRVVAVSTAVDPDGQNFPPSEWFEREGWTSLALRDDTDSTLIRGLGGVGFPYAVYLDADNVVVARTVGSVGAEQVVQLAERIGQS